MTHLRPTVEEKLLRSHMFIKEKRDGKGVFEKVKGQLAGDGRIQDKELYQKLEPFSAPIKDVSMELELVLHEKKNAPKVDVSGAYLNQEIEDMDGILMCVTKDLTCIFVEGMSEPKWYVDG